MPWQSTALWDADTPARDRRLADELTHSAATLALNPYDRDALYSGADAYFDVGQYGKVPPLMRRLVANEPASLKAYTLAANAFLAMSNAAERDKWPTLQKAYRDSTAAWCNAGHAVGWDLQLNEWSLQARQLVIGGTVSDLRPSPATAAVSTPRVLTLALVALSRTGATRATDTLPLSVAVGRPTPFHMSFFGEDIVAFKYIIVH